MDKIILKPNDDVNVFLKVVNEIVSAGKKVNIEIYGYLYTVNANIPKEMVIIAIKRILKDIKDINHNIEIIKSLNVLTDIELDELKDKYPEEIALAARYYQESTNIKRSSR